jgi:hypothetical protein
MIRATTVWTNSAGLAAAHFTKDTPNPEGGTIVRGADGEPNGVLLETAARVYDKVVPDWTEEEYVSAAREATHIANAYGITSIKDAGAFHPAGMAFSRLDKAGELTLNVAVCVRTPYGARSTPLDYSAIERERDQYRTKRVHTEFVKLFLDGVPTPARTAAMVAPYVHDDEHGDHFTGSMHIDPELLEKDVIETGSPWVHGQDACGGRLLRSGWPGCDRGSAQGEPATRVVTTSWRTPALSPNRTCRASANWMRFLTSAPCYGIRHPSLMRSSRLPVSAASITGRPVRCSTAERRSRQAPTGRRLSQMRTRGRVLKRS